MTEELGRLLTGLGVQRILDCAAGSGVPSIGLRQMGLPVTCSDGSPEMVERFKLNAKRAGADGDVQCDVVDWADLDPADGRYDYLMCRGNSLVYASTWGTDADAAVGLGALEHYLQRFAAVIEPGGWLHIDAPAAMGSGTARTTGHAVDAEGEPVAVTITESVIERTRSRFWTCIVQAEFVDGTVGRLSFAMHSAKLTIDVLEPLLARNGFIYWGRPDLGGDRPSHPALLARRDPMVEASSAGRRPHRPSVPMTTAWPRPGRRHEALPPLVSLQ
ncbi:MAG: class I SAM-dependent methyltransferase [Actinomycetota bacterium]